jgi:flavodoxin
VNVLIVYGSQYGNTQRIAQAVARALEAAHAVRLVQAAEAAGVTGEGVDLLFVGAPTQMHGLRLLAKPFLAGLAERAFAGVAAAAFDTRMGAETDGRALESTVIEQHLVDAGCRIVVPAESFLVTGFEGPLAIGEDERAAAWARSVVAAAEVAKTA